MNKLTDVKLGDARCDAQSFSDLLDNDTRDAPAILEESFSFRGLEDSDAAIYTSQKIVDLEFEKLWPKVWQLACRVEDILNVGDTHIYEIGDWSFLVVRSEADSINAFYNSCLHRGRKLRTRDGNAKRFRCPFHGFTWEVDGQFHSAPCKWDFPQLEERDMSLPQVKVETWAGFVFINMDPDCEPLSDYLGVLPEHFNRWRLEECTKIVHVKKRMACNWKVSAEAFMEAMHVEVTHPQIMSFSADINGRYDTFGEHVNRNITPMGVPSPLVKSPPSEQEIVDTLVTGSGRIVEGADQLKLKEGQTAREFMAAMSRVAFNQEDGYDYSDATDSEMLDAYTYNLFPNMSPWGGFPPNITYRWLPDGRDPDSCFMEVMILKRVPKGEDIPKGCKMIELSDDQGWSSLPELDALGPIFDQDMANLPFVQEGLKSSQSKKVILANYQESRIRHFHQTLLKYLS
ncbi:MAG: nitrite reductase/ring-hydroxylating ferredoxin subunit [Arenicella sp.]|jgi:nitrite reductase/ring-hydroxylating ferredoxin subunit